MSDKLREILFDMYREGFEAGIARSDKHDFDVTEENLKKIKKWALGLLPKYKEIPHDAKNGKELADVVNYAGYNQAIAEMRKKMKEE